MDEKKQIETARRTLVELNKDVVIIPRVLINFFSSMPLAALFKQLVFWSDKGGNSDGWVYKTAKELAVECCLSKDQIDRFMTKLSKMGAVEFKLKKAHGAPTRHYRISYALLVEIGLKATERMELAESLNGNSESYPQAPKNTSNKEVLGLLHETGETGLQATEHVDIAESLNGNSGIAKTTCSVDIAESLNGYSGIAKSITDSNSYSNKDNIYKEDSTFRDKRQEVSAKMSEIKNRLASGVSLADQPSFEIAEKPTTKKSTLHRKINIENLQGVGMDIACEFIDYRKDMKCGDKFTQRAFNMTLKKCRECAALNLVPTPDRAIEIILEKGWKSIEPKFLENLVNQQRGFNNENNNGSNQQPKLSAVDRVGAETAAWAERQTNGDALGAHDANIRPQVGEPIRDSAEPGMANVIEGNFTTDDSHGF